MPNHYLIKCWLSCIFIIIIMWQVEIFAATNPAEADHSDTIQEVMNKKILYASSKMIKHHSNAGYTFCNLVSLQTGIFSSDFAPVIALFKILRIVPIMVKDRQYWFHRSCWRYQYSAAYWFIWKILQYTCIYFCSRDVHYPSMAAFSKSLYHFEIMVLPVSHSMDLATPGNVEHWLSMHLCLAGRSQKGHLYWHHYSHIPYK